MRACSNAVCDSGIIFIMPFTLAHPAAVVPLASKRLALSALVAGSMAPDFAYFIPAHINRNIGHTFAGVFYFCIPAGLLALLIFHCLLKEPIISLLPDFHRRRLAYIAAGFRFMPLTRLLLLAVAIVIGALTHIGWDSVTHEHRLLTTHLEFLGSPVMHTMYGTVRLFRLLQHCSTIFGGSLLAYWYFKWAMGASEAPLTKSNSGPKLVIVGAICVTVCAVALLYAHSAVPVLDGFNRLRTFGHRAVVAAGTTLFAELVLFSTLWRLRQRLRRKSG